MADSTRFSATEFISQLRDLRDAYNTKRNNTNLYCGITRDLDIDHVNRTYSFWFKESHHIRFLRIIDAPGLSGDILRLNANLPPLSLSSEIEGDVIRPLSSAGLPALPIEPEDDSMDVSSELDLLPLVDISGPRDVFLKRPKYGSEIVNYLRCQDGCPAGKPSPYVVQLLGKSSDGRLVFPKYLNRQKATPPLQTLAIYQKWIRQLLLGVKHLHSVGIIHRDLRADNLLWNPDTQDLVICDLETRWGNRNAPEIIHNDRTEGAGWSEASDIWDIGECIKYILYGNAPINNVVEWEVPPPFAEIVVACQGVLPSERASLDELLQMIMNIDVQSV